MLTPYDIVEITVLIAINTLSIFIVILIFSNSIKDRANLWLAVLAIAIIGWVNTAYLGFSLEDSNYATLFYRINGAFVATFLIAAYQFYIVEFLKIKNSLLKYTHHTVNIILVFISLFTGLIVEGVMREEWGNEAIFGLGYNFLTVYSTLFSTSLIVLFIYNYFRFHKERKRQVRFFLIGTAFIVVFNILFNISAL